MTLVVAVPATDGLVFGSDQQVTSGEVRHTARKIVQLSQHVLWAGAGELAVIQRVAERLASFSGRDEPLERIRDLLSGHVKNAVESLIQMDFRTPFVAQNPEALLNLHPADFLFAEHRGQPRVLHVLTNGTSEWVENRFAATGNGELFAHALLKKYSAYTLPCDRAKLLTYKVIEEAIEVGAYGLGLPIDLWEITSAGARRADEREIASIADAARLLREREIGMLADGSPDDPEAR